MDSPWYRRDFKHRFWGNRIWSQTVGELFEKQCLIVHELKIFYTKLFFCVILNSFDQQLSFMLEFMNTWLISIRQSLLLSRFRSGGIPCTTHVHNLDLLFSQLRESQRWQENRWLPCVGVGMWIRVNVRIEPWGTWCWSLHQFRSWA